MEQKSFGLWINTKFTFSIPGLGKAGLQNSIKLIHFTKILRVRLKVSLCSRTTNIAQFGPRPRVDGYFKSNVMYYLRPPPRSHRTFALKTLSDKRYLVKFILHKCTASEIHIYFTSCLVCDDNEHQKIYSAYSCHQSFHNVKSKS